MVGLATAETSFAGIDRGFEGRDFAEKSIVLFTLETKHDQWWGKWNGTDVGNPEEEQAPCLLEGLMALSHRDEARNDAQRAGNNAANRCRKKNPHHVIQDKLAPSIRMKI